MTKKKKRGPGRPPKVKRGRPPGSKTKKAKRGRPPKIAASPIKKAKPAKKRGRPKGKKAAGETLKLDGSLVGGLIHQFLMKLDAIAIAIQDQTRMYVQLESEHNAREAVEVPPKPSSGILRGATAQVTPPPAEKAVGALDA